VIAPPCGRAFAEVGSSEDSWVFHNNGKAQPLMANSLFPASTEFDDLVARAPSLPPSAGVLGFDLGASLEDRLAWSVRGGAEERERHIARLQRRLDRLQKPKRQTIKQQVKEIEATVDAVASSTAAAVAAAAAGGATAATAAGGSQAVGEERSSLLAMASRSDGLAAMAEHPVPGQPAWHAVAALLAACPCLALVNGAMRPGGYDSSEDER